MKPSLQLINSIYYGCYMAMRYGQSMHAHNLWTHAENLLSEHYPTEFGMPDTMSVYNRNVCRENAAYYHLKLN